MWAYNGGYCGGSNSPINANRNGTMNFVCVSDDKISVVPPKEMDIYIYKNDTYDCSFNFYYQSGVSCPWNCLQVVDNITESENGKGYTVCNGHGMCIWDKEVSFTRCICHEGWTGLACDTQESGGGGGGSTIIFNLEEEELLGIIVGLCLLLLIVSCIFWRCYLRLHGKINKIKTLDNTYLVNDNGDKFVEEDDKKSNITVYSDDKSDGNSNKLSMSSNDNDSSQDSLDNGDREEENNLLQK